MRVLFLLLLASVLSLNVLGQKAISPTTGCQPFTVDFEAPSTSSTYYWDFGDGVPSVEKNPSNSYGKAGTYFVRFRESVNGPIIGDPIKITVYEQPKLSYTVEPAFSCPNVDLKFNSTSIIDPEIKVNAFRWVFGDGFGVESATDSVRHSYSKVGEYNIFLELKTDYPACNKTLQFEEPVRILNAPVAIFETTPPVPVSCEASLNVSFKNNSTGDTELKYSWDLGNGVKSSDLNAPAQDYTSGQYYVSLKAEYSKAPRCNSTTGKGISVGKPNANIIPEKDTLCTGNLSYVKTNAIGSYFWEFDDGTYFDNDRTNKDSISMSFYRPGEHTVKLTVSSPNGLCSDTKTIKIYVDELRPTIESTPSFGCSSPMNIQYKAVISNPNLSYEWKFTDDPVTYKTATVNHKYKSVTDSIYYGVNGYEPKVASLLVTSNLSGCKGVAVKTDTMWLPNARFMPNVTKGCAPLKVTFSDSSKTFIKNPIVSWKWLFDDNGASNVRSDSNDVSYTYTNPGEYFARLIVTTKAGCVDTSFAIKIEVGDHIESLVTFESDKSSVCPGETVTFKVNSAPSYVDAFHFSTEDNRMFHCSGQQSVAWSYNHVVGPQTVSLTVDYNGCFSEITKPAMVNVKGAIAKIDYTAFCNDPYVYNFESKSINASKVSWDFGDKTGTSAGISESYDFKKSGDFNVRLTAESSDGCPATVDEVIVHPRKVKAKITLEDSLMCIMDLVNLSAVNSEDVYAGCRTGYTWEFPTMKQVRPVTLNASSTEMLTLFKGEHILKLTVQDINGCRSTDSTRIKIYDMSVNAKPNRSQICLPTQPGSVKFAELSVADTTITKWNWNFGDGNTTQYNAFVDSVGHDYLDSTRTGLYTYSLTVTDILGCEETYSATLPIYKPYTKIGADQMLCVGETVKISAPDFTTAGSFLKYDWNFGNNTTGTLSENDITYNTEGRFWVKLNYEEAVSLCKGKDSIELSVQGYPKAKYVTPIMNSYAVICADINPDIKNLSYPSDPVISPIVSTKWEGKGQDPVYDRVPEWSFKRGADNFIKVTVTTANGCSSDTTGVFEAVNAEGNFVKSKDTICLDEEVEFYLIDTIDVKRWEWTFEGVLLEKVDHVTHKFKAHPEGENAIAKLKLESNRGGCFRLFEQKIYIHPVIADFSRESEPLDTNICFNDGPFHLSDKSTNSNFFKWNFGDNSPEDSITTAPVHQYAAPGQYNVTLTIKNYKHGCVDTLTKVAVVHPNPKVVASGDTMCFGSDKKIALNVLNPVSTSKYLWSPADGLDNVNISNPTADPGQTTLYRVVETDTATGCTDFTEVTGLVVKRIDLHDWDTTIVIGDIATLPLYGEPIYKFKWTPDKYLSCTDCFYPTAQPLEDITYNLEVTDVYNCFIDPFKYEITVKPETFVKLPSAFTPNEDSKNDKVYVKGWGIKKLVEYKVFNRWGQEIFSTDNINEGWDGTFKGQKQNSDVYVYKVKVITWKEEEKYVEGYINLLY
jgi:gliding motility-associated-like protein